MTHQILTNKWTLSGIGLLILFASGCAHLHTTLTTPPVYHFREVRWGSSKASVMLSEQGKRIHFDKGDTLVFKHRHKDVPLLLVYCFRENRLRAAGYLTANPATLINPDRLFRQALLETLGDPTETLAEGGMLWTDENTLIYTNMYPVSDSNLHLADFSAQIGINAPRRRISSSLVMVNPRPTQTWHGVCAYIDMDFYNMINAEEQYPFALAELSYYEEILFGLFETVSKDRLHPGTD